MGWKIVPSKAGGVANQGVPYDNDDDKPTPFPYEKESRLTPILLAGGSVS